MGADVEEYVKSCVKYQMTKRNTQPKIENLRSLPLPKQYYLLNIDGLYDGQLEDGGYDAIMVIVFQWIKWATFVPCSKQTQPKRWPNCS